jgi:hypothetical protein
LLGICLIMTGLLQVVSSQILLALLAGEIIDLGQFHSAHERQTHAPVNGMRGELFDLKLVQKWRNLSNEEKAVRGDDL